MSQKSQYINLESLFMRHKSQCMSPENQFISLNSLFINLKSLLINLQAILPMKGETIHTDLNNMTLMVRITPMAPAATDPHIVVILGNSPASIKTSMMLLPTSKTAIVDMEAEQIILATLDITMGKTMVDTDN